MYQHLQHKTHICPFSIAITETEQPPARHPKPSAQVKPICKAGEMRKVAQLEKLPRRSALSAQMWLCIYNTHMDIFNDNYFFSAASNVPVTTRNDFAISTLGNLQVKGEETTARSSRIKNPNLAAAAARDFWESRLPIILYLCALNSNNVLNVKLPVLMWFAPRY